MMRPDLDRALLRTAAYKLKAWQEDGPSGSLTDEEVDLYMAAAIRAAHLLADMLDGVELGMDEYQ
jgi:hypothetical protein